MEQFVAWKAMMVAGEPTSLWQQFYVLFYQAFIENDRWLQYLNGVVTTLYVTVLALVLGIVLGIIVAVVRTAHDQQRPGHKSVVLGFFNAILKIYVTVIRGTPMMVQLMIMGLAAGEIEPIMLRPQTRDNGSLMLGYAGVYSSFLLHVYDAAKKYDLDPRDILVELGRRRMVGGQDPCRFPPRRVLRAKDAPCWRQERQP